MDDLKVFTGSAHPALAQGVVDYLGIPLGQREVFEFSNESEGYDEGYFLPNGWRFRRTGCNLDCQVRTRLCPCHHGCLVSGADQKVPGDQCGNDKDDYIERPFPHT